MQLYEQLERALECMPEKEQDEFLGAWYRYVTAGQEPNFKRKTPRAVFETMRFSMAKQRAGRLGGKAQAKAEADEQADNEAKGQANGKANAQHNNNNNNYINKEEIYKEEKLLAFEEIVTYLNERAGTSYRPTSRKTRSLINARLDEGFTIEDFKTVIDAKCDDWRGSDMEKYLRPETLFGTKFESYLNSPKPRLETRVEAW